MVCPRCGWIMRLLNIRDHSNYSDELYQCKCGTTHLHIVSRDYGAAAKDLFGAQRPLQTTSESGK